MNKFKGRIWPEYWIDCCKCEHHQPLAATKAPAAAARKQGWKREGNAYSGAWVCPECSVSRPLHSPTENKGE